MLLVQLGSAGSSTATVLLAGAARSSWSCSLTLPAAALPLQDAPWETCWSRHSSTHPSRSAPRAAGSRHGVWLQQLWVERAPVPASSHGVHLKSESVLLELQRDETTNLIILKNNGDILKIDLKQNLKPNI